MKTIKERLQLFFAALEAAEAVASADAALELLAQTLDAIEDAHSGVSKADNPSLDYDGRMYPPREDYTFRQNGSIKALTKGHMLMLGCDGSISIYSRKHPNDLVFFKQGAAKDGYL